MSPLTFLARVFHRTAMAFRDTDFKNGVSSGKKQQIPGHGS
jgi:hypothetical protein